MIPVMLRVVLVTTDVLRTGSNLSGLNIGHAAVWIKPILGQEKRLQHRITPTNSNQYQRQA